MCLVSWEMHPCADALLKDRVGLWRGEHVTPVVCDCAHVSVLLVHTPSSSGPGDIHGNLGVDQDQNEYSPVPDGFLDGYIIDRIFARKKILF